MRYLVLFALLAVSASAQQTSTVAPNAEKFELAGTVVNAITGEPVKSARVRIEQAGPTPGIGATTADSGGRFSFPSLEPGVYRLNAEKQGYTHGGQASGMTTLQLGPSRTGVAIKLIPQAVIAGKVVDENGDPLFGAQVQVYASQVVDGRSHLVPRNGSSTNDLGEFRISDLAPGRYFLKAMVQPGGRGPGRRPSYGPFYFPAAADLISAAPIDLAPGGQFRVEMALAQRQLFTIQGAVSEVLPRAGGQLILTRQDAGESTNSGFNPSNGQFRISAAPGFYRLRAIQQDGQNTRTGETTVVVKEADVDGVNIRLTPAIELVGSIRSPADTPPGFTGMQLALHPRDSDPRQQRVSATRIEQDGSFKIPGVVPGTYELIVRPPPGTYASSITAGGRDAIGDGLVIGEAGAPGPLEVTLSQDGATIDGAVGDAASALTVLLLADGANGIIPLTTSTDAQGHFTFRDVRPGDYHVYALEPEEMARVEYRNPEAMRRLDSIGSRVSAQASGHHTIELKSVRLGSDAL